MFLGDTQAAMHDGWAAPKEWELGVWLRASLSLNLFFRSCDKADLSESE